MKNDNKPQIGDVILDRDGNGSAGVVTTVDRDSVLYDDCMLDSNLRVHCHFGDVEVIARPPAGFDFDDSDTAPLVCRRDDLVRAAVALLRTSINVGNTRLTTETTGSPTPAALLLLGSAHDDLLDVARRLLAAADYDLVPEGGSHETA